MQQTEPEQPVQTAAPAPILQRAKVDARFLQDPNIYHQVPTEDVAPSFLRSADRPSPDFPLSALIQHGHFRLAANSALDQLLKCESTDAETILELLHTRLACLILISRPDIASQEALPLTEILSRGPPGAKDVVPLIPWELRLLLVRLQSLGAEDGGRRGIMALYALASEIRARIHDCQGAGSEAERQAWSDRLCDLGLRVADSFVEMGELETASRYLDTLKDFNGNEIATRKALLRIRVGDVGGAQRSVARIQNEQTKAVLNALLMTSTDLPAATDAWRQLAGQDAVDHALSAQNLAVCMLYTGHITEARQTLEQLAVQSPAFPTMLFNLSTVYELCSERAMEHKAALMARMASRQPDPSSGGWERASYEFKL